MSAWFMDIPVTRAVFAGVSATEFHRVQKASSSDWASCKTWWAPTFFRWRVPVYLSKPCNTYSRRFLLHQSAGIVKHCCRMTQPSRIYWESVCRTAAWQPQYINHCKAIAQAQNFTTVTVMKDGGQKSCPHHLSNVGRNHAPTSHRLELVRGITARSVNEQKLNTCGGWSTGPGRSIPCCCAKGSPKLNLPNVGWP